MSRTSENKTKVVSDEVKAEIRQKQNEFLDIYSLYLETGSQWVKEAAIEKAFELHLLDPNLSFEI